MLTALDLTNDPMAPVPFEVVGRHEETHDTISVVLDAPDGFEFRPGQFNMLYAFGIGESAISISGDPAEQGKLVHTVRKVGKVTAALHRLQPGDAVGVRGPFGTPWPVGLAAGRDLLIVAGGIGLAPVRPAVYEALANRERYGRVVILYGARTPGDLVFVDQIRQWRGRFDTEVEVSVDSAGPDYRGSVGVVTRLIAKAGLDPGATIAFVCGPEIMMRFTAADLDGLGVDAEDIYLSMERNMQCAVGFCGHCQFGNRFVCRDGPVFPYASIRRYLDVREV
jgi:NAD(P)H-flavin reductase